MSIVVEMRECRICPCTDFGSAPACTIQVAHEVRCERQFTLSPSAGRRRDVPFQNVPVVHRLPVLHGLENQIVGTIRLHDFVMADRSSGLDLDREPLETVNAINHLRIDRDGRRTAGVFVQLQSPRQ